MQSKLLVKNKRAFFDFEILEKIEAGIILTGAEVKSAKLGRLQMRGSFVTITNGRPWIQHVHISPYQYAPREGYDPDRTRELLLHAKEIQHLAGLTNEKGITVVPLEFILKRNIIKVLLGVCRGKKLRDKRLSLKKKAINREIEQSLKSRGRERNV